MKIIQVSRTARGDHLPNKTKGLMGYHGGYYVYEFGISTKQDDIESTVTFTEFNGDERIGYRVLNEEITILGDL